MARMSEHFFTFLNNGARYASGYVPSIAARTPPRTWVTAAAMVASSISSLFKRSAVLPIRLKMQCIMKRFPWTTMPRSVGDAWSADAWSDIVLIALSAGLESCTKLHSRFDDVVGLNSALYGAAVISA